MMIITDGGIINGWSSANVAWGNYLRVLFSMSDSFVISTLEKGV